MSKKYLSILSALMLIGSSFVSAMEEYTESYDPEAPGIQEGLSSLNNKTNIQNLKQGKCAKEFNCSQYKTPEEKKKCEEMKQQCNKFSSFAEETYFGSGAEQNPSYKALNASYVDQYNTEEKLNRPTGNFGVKDTVKRYGNEILRSDNLKKVKLKQNLNQSVVKNDDGKVYTSNKFKRMHITEEKTKQNLKKTIIENDGQIHKKEELTKTPAEEGYSFSSGGIYDDFNQ